ncbi:5'-nucleotidase, partial [Accumulibacter sp.]
YRQASKLADIALQNAGGIRNPLAAGEVTFNTAYTVLPFTNVLYEFQLTGREIVGVLDDALANHLDHGSSDGSHPYAAGLRWDLDMSQARGSRLTNLEVKRKASGQWQPLELDRSYTLVTSDFLASGGDGYAGLAAIHRAGRSVNTYLNYTQTFVDYLLARGDLRRPIVADYSHKSVRTRSGQSLP